MPSAKKIAPSTKTRATASSTRSQKQRSPKTSGSKSKEKARTPAVVKNKKSGAATGSRADSRSKAAAKRTASVSAAKIAAKPARTRASKAGRTAARSVARKRTPTSVKQTGKAAKTQTAARKRQEKTTAAVPQKTTAAVARAARKKLPPAEAARAKVARRKTVKEAPVATRQEAEVQSIGSAANVVSESLVVLAVETATTTGIGEARAPLSEPSTITLETSDHQPVTQKVQKKTVATPLARLAAAAEKAAPAPLPVTPVAKPATEKSLVAESKLREAKPTAAQVEEGKPGEKPAVPKPAKTSVARPNFKTAEFIVYPAHGVGQIIAIEEQEVAGFKLELFVVSFVKDKMILKVPVPKAVSVGMRKLGNAEVVKKALNTLAGRARVKRTMWSRRAQEYEAKINSGDLVAIAEVVRDLYRSEAQPEQSYSERQLYEAALDRVAREIAVVQKLTETESLRLIEAQLQKGPRRGKLEEVESDLAEGDEGDDGDIEEAA